MVLSVRDLQGAWNFRDVADSTGVLRPGRLFRSGELSDLGDGGRDELSRLGITDVADLRSRREVGRHGPGLVPDGVEIDAFPDEVYREAPSLREYRYIHRDSRTYIVEPQERRVIEEID